MATLYGAQTKATNSLKTIHRFGGVLSASEPPSVISNASSSQYLDNEVAYPTYPQQTQFQWAQHSRSIKFFNDYLHRIQESKVTICNSLMVKSQWMTYFRVRVNADNVDKKRKGGLCLWNTFQLSAEMIQLLDLTLRKVNLVLTDWHYMSPWSKIWDRAIILLTLGPNDLRMSIRKSRSVSASTGVK